MIDSHKTLTEKFLKKWFWLYLFSFIIAPIGYIIRILISSDISVEEVWILYWIIGLVWMISAYNDFWMSESLKYFLPKFIEKKEYNKVKSVLFYAFFIQWTTSLLIASLFYFWAEFLWENYFKSQDAIEALKVFAFFFIWINIFWTLSTFFLAIQNTFLNKFIDFIKMFFVMWTVIFIFMWWNWSLINYSYWWLIWLYTWLIVAISAFYIKYYKKYFKNYRLIIDKKLKKEVASYAWLVIIWTWAWTLLSQIDMQMVIYLLWTKDAGYYANYMSILFIPNLLIWPIFAFLFPVFSQLYVKKEVEKIKLIKQIFTKIFILLAIMFSFFFFALSSNIAYTLFWEKFMPSWEILKYSMLFLVFSILIQINFNLLAWIWKIKTRVKILFIAVIFNITMNIILIKTIWVNGAALATWLGWVLIFLLSEYFLWKKYLINYDIKNISINVLILWWLASILYIYAPLFINWFSRLKTFFIILWLWFIWFSIFILINFKEFKLFIGEVMKLRK